MESGDIQNPPEQFLESLIAPVNAGCLTDIFVEESENGDRKNPPEQSLEKRITPVDTRWLTANVEGEHFDLLEVNQRYNQIRELIENGAELFADKSDACHERQCQLISHIEEMLHKHQLLAEQYEQLQSSCNNNLSTYNQLNVGDTIIGFPNESCFQTPDTKSIGHHVNAEAPSTVSSQMSGGGSSDTSGNEDSEYSAISSDSDSETYNPSAYKSAKSHLDAHKMLEHHFLDKVGGIDEGPLGKMTKFEEELSPSRNKLQLSESEVSRLQKEVEELTGTFESQLDSAQNELQKQEIAFEMEKKKVMVLQNQVSILENQIVNFNAKIGSLEKEQGLAKLKLESSEEGITDLKSCHLNKNSDYPTELKNQLELAQQQVALLDVKLDLEKRQASEMQDKIQQYISDIENRDEWIQKLKTVLQEATDKSHEDEVQLQSHISSLTEHLMLVEASSDEWENRCESLEEQLLQCEADMSEMRRLHELEEIRWKNDTDLFKTELNIKVGSLEILNKDLDTLKLKYGVLEAEKVGADLKVQTLEADLVSKENHILQMEGLLQQLHLEKVEMISVSDSSRKKYEDMRLKFKDLEKEVQSHKVLILDRAEEKREAIRQLCFAMEYYRNRYEGLLQACTGLK